MGSSKKTDAILAFLKEHWIVVSTVFIGLYSAAALFYVTSYYDSFGISYLYFAELSDLLKHLFLSNTFLVSITLFVGVILLLSQLENEEQKGVSSQENPSKVAVLTLSLVVIPLALFIVTAPAISPALDALSVKMEVSHILNLSITMEKTKSTARSL